MTALSYLGQYFPSNHLLFISFLKAPKIAAEIINKVFLMVLSTFQQLQLTYASI